MNTASRSLAAGLAFAVAATVPALAASKKNAPAPKAPSYEITKVETDAGLSATSVNGKPFAIRAGFLNVCNTEKTHQLVVPLSLAYDIEDATKMKVTPEDRVRAVTAIQKRAMNMLGEFSQSRGSLVALSSRAGTQQFGARLMEFAGGISIGAKLNLNLLVDGRIVPAAGCGDITTRELYEKARDTFLEEMRKARMPQARFDPV